MLFHLFSTSTSASAASPSYGCLPPHDNLPFCDRSKSSSERALAVAQNLTVAELVAQMDGDMSAIDRLGIPAYHYGWEALHGPIMDCPFDDRCYTSFACSSASVASFNRTLWFNIGKAQSDELRGMWNDGMLDGLHLRGPQLNPVRDPRWGRSDNSPGEDAFAEGEYGAQLVLGGQGADVDGSYINGEKRKSISEMKHFTAYSVEDDRNTKPDTWDIGLRDLAEYYFVPLKTCIDKADVGAFMCSYNAINGTAACGDEWMNVEVVRKHWNWTGVIESDCGAISGISAHGNALDQAGAAVKAVKATLDMECDSAYKNHLVEAEEKKRVSRQELEAAVARVYKGRFQIGQFDPPSTSSTSPGMGMGMGSQEGSSAPYWESLTSAEVFSKAHQQLSLEAAQQSIVLLRNNKPAGNISSNSSNSSSNQALLPLRRGQKIAVVGPNGNVSDVYAGQYHGAFCAGNGHDHYDYSCLPSLFDAVAEANGAQALTTFACGCKYDKHREQTGPQSCSELEGMDALLADAKAADVVLLAIGLDIKVTSSEGTDRSHDQAGYALPGKQLEIVKAVAALNKPTVVVLLSGMAVGIDYIAARPDWPLVVPGYGGIFGPKAIAQVLFGDVAPTGKLPYTIYPESWAGATPMEDMSLTAGEGRTYRFFGYKDGYSGKTASLTPTFAFGSGISFTTFNLTVSGPAAAAYDTKFRGSALGTFTCRVANTGAVAASEAILMYMRPRPDTDADAELSPPSPLPRRQLIDFARTPVLAPGKLATLTFTVAAMDLSMVDYAGRRAVFAGDYDVIFSRGAEAEEVQKSMHVTQTTLLDTLPSPHK